MTSKQKGRIRKLADFIGGPVARMNRTPKQAAKVLRRIAREG